MQRITSTREFIGGLALQAAVMMIVLAGYPAMAASTLDDYQRRVERARSVVDTLISETDDIGREGVAAGVNIIEGFLPDTETVEQPGGSVEVDNRWLRIRLKEFTDETDEVRKLSILASISERLAAISESVKQLNDVALGETTKDENKQKLAEILRREEYQKPPEPEKSVIQKWIDELINWLAKAFPRPEITPGTSSGLGSLQFGLQILVYALVIGLLGLLAYKLAPLIIRSIGTTRGLKPKARVILGERVEAHESSSGLFDEADRLAREGDIRSAIRKGYIALLCELSDRDLIRLAHHKTNRDYLRDVRKNESLFAKVNSMTRNYERNWYGLRPAAEEDWNDFRGMYMDTVAHTKS